jgi:uncharacterized membrane protein
MNKQDFLAALRGFLNDLPAEDIRRSLDFYAEMIDDHMEEGITEEDAVAAVGSAEQIADQIRGDAGAAPRKPKRKVKPWSLALILLGLPLWLPLLLAAASVIISIYVSIWAVIISLYATAVALGISSIVIFLMPLLYIPTGNVAGACLVLGAAMVLTGITILLFVGLKPVTKGTVWLTKKSFVWLKRLFVGKEAAQ